MLDDISALMSGPGCAAPLSAAEREMAEAVGQRLLSAGGGTPAEQVRMVETMKAELDAAIAQAGAGGSVSIDLGGGMRLAVGPAAAPGEAPPTPSGQPSGQPAGTTPSGLPAGAAAAGTTT